MSTQAPTTHHEQRLPLVLEEISILRAPGISPGFTLSNLSPDITIVFGPNASGKSTTARAIQAVLWPHQSALRGHHLAASFALGDEHWSIEASAGNVQRSRNGEQVTAPLIAPLDDRGRYSLGLPELLASENQPLAQAILNESSGGFNLPQVAESLGFTSTIPPRLEATHQVRSAAESLTQVISDQNQQLQRIAGRGELQSRRAESLAAEREMHAIATALEYQRNLTDEQEARSEIERFPTVVRALTGDEPAHIGELNSRIATQSGQIADAMRQRERWQQAIDSTGLGRIENPAQQLVSLRRIIDQQSEIDTLLTEAERDVAAAISERTAHQKRLAVDLDDEQITALDAEGMREFADIAASYENIRSRRTARDEVEIWLGGVTPPENLPALQQGVETLQTRLQYPNATEQRESFGKPRWIGISAGLLLAAAGAILALSLEPLWWMLTALGVVLMALAWKFTSSSSPRIAAELESTYGALPLPQPEAWRAHFVRDLLGQLRDELNVAMVEQEKADRWQDLEQERQELDEAWAATDARRKDAIGKYGVAPDLKEESLRLLADNLSRWQAADANLRGIEGRRNRLKADRTTLAMRVEKSLSALGYADGDPDHLDDLEKRIETHEHASAQHEEMQQLIVDELQPKLDAVLADRDAVYSRLGLETDDTAGLQLLMQQRDDLLRAQQRLEARRRDVRTVWEDLSLTPELREMDVAALNSARDRAQQTASKREEIEAQLNALDREERSASRSQNREIAQTAVATAKHQLLAERDRVMENVVGDLLLSTVQQETRDAALPIVFHRARELFAIITRGKYELQFEAGPPPEFTALDTGTALSLSLDQLSSGTRVQLLMAIRLAFVENVEVGPRLPVILDETLGNSDEFRASAIIDAAIDICRHGRQVFYFTAQGDEVARWLHRVESMPEDDRPQIKVIELAEIRRDAGFDRLPIPPTTVAERTALPSPVDYDAQTWAAALRVPAIDPWAASVGSVHLWHVVPDAEVLYALLSDDIVTLGQLSSLERSNPEQLESIHPGIAGLLSGIHLRAELLNNALNMWRIGRAQPMPAGILADAEMIDAAALPEMHVLQSGAGNDGHTLLEHVQTMEDPPLAEKPLDALELWMISEGFIAQGNPMSTGDIRTRIIELASPAIRSGELEAADIDQLMNQLASW